MTPEIPPRGLVEEFRNVVDPVLPGEVWKSIPSFPRYEASNLGRIRSLYGVGQWGKRKLRKTPKILCLVANKRHRYLAVCVSSTGKPGVHRWVHALVCEAFNGVRPDGQECAHLDGVRTNCRADNLAWKSPADNQRDKLRHGTLLRGEADPKSILKEEEVRFIKSSTLSQRLLGLKFGVSPSTIQNIKDGRNWKHVV